MHSKTFWEALDLIACHSGSNVRGLTPEAHSIINANIKDLLDSGLIQYAPKKAMGYALTAKGKVAMSSVRAGE